ncbi:MAG: helix-turn-helix domain-containing protein [Streptococcaceae bacterium]|jgi:hypothetical protein|nr:helix-turn-helix domain-containing protein [Streptococcaceae bacterium]
MTDGKHITYEDRKLIEKYLKEGKSKTEISRLLNRSRQSITREISRYAQKISVEGGDQPMIYKAEKSFERFKMEHTQSLRPRVMTDEIIDIIEKMEKSDHRPKEIYLTLFECYGEDAPSVATVYRKLSQLKTIEESMVKKLLLAGDNCFAVGNYNRAFTKYKQGAELGEADCIYNLGLMYLLGLGTEQSKSKAIRAFKAASKQDNPKAHWQLGLCYHNGYGVQSDYKQAFHYFQMAAEAGNENGQVYLAYYYEHGLAMIHSTRDARIWYNKAAEQGNSYAKNWLLDYPIIDFHSSKRPLLKEEWLKLFKFNKHREPSEAEIEAARLGGEFAELVE